MGKRNFKRKQELVFDENKRKDFLTGFSKRKQQRKKKAAEDFQKKLKEEQKRIKEETKDFKNKLKVSFQPIEELKDLLEDSDKEEYETEDVTVSISTLDTDKLARKKNFIGVRPPNFQEPETKSDESDENEDADPTKIPGMESDEEANSKNKKEIDPEILKIQNKLKSDRDIKKLIKQKAKESLKKSKIIKTRDIKQKKKSVKQSHRKKHFQEKFLKKHKKIPRRAPK